MLLFPKRDYKWNLWKTLRNLQNTWYNNENLFHFVGCIGDFAVTMIVIIEFDYCWSNFENWIFIQKKSCYARITIIDFQSAGSDIPLGIDVGNDWTSKFKDVNQNQIFSHALFICRKQGFFNLFESRTIVKQDFITWITKLGSEVYYSMFLYRNEIFVDCLRDHLNISKIGVRP